MGTQIHLHRAEPHELDTVTQVFARAGADEAVTAWITDNEPGIVEQYRTVFAPQTIADALRDDEIWVAGDGTEIWAVSLWQTVHTHDRLHRDAAYLRDLYDQAPHPSLRRLRALTGLLSETHPAEFPHRYLQAIVTLPEHRGKGAGAALVTDRADAAAADGLPTYLEASTERSAHLYTRCGFALEGELIALPEDGPVLRPMWFRG
ncbi:GNAT family N-acetyltransferase [Nocardia sp. NPDC127579]|uniref:GNAT family N-acetyltransferase n=1 Tax=Nocardia sp. NPDC127579 TaxID=3345402 RepID=UPI003642BD8B